MAPSIEQDISSGTQKSKDIHTLPDELLVQILFEIPVEHRVDVRRVSQKWKSIISDLGFHIEPLFMLPDLCHIPIYPAQTKFKKNQAILSFCQSAVQANDEICGRPQTVGSELTRAELSTKRSEFITCPPIGTVSISSRQKGTSICLSSCDAVLRTATPALTRSEGIRIGDLLDVIDNMKASVSDGGSDRIFTVWHGTVKNNEYGIVWKVSEPATGDSGIELRVQG